jgi:hypothetical protein
VQPGSSATPETDRAAERPAYFDFFERFLTVSVTVVSGWRLTVDFFTNRPVFALRFSFAIAFASCSRG